MSKASRREALMPGGVPKYIRCYKSKDDVADPYTVVYTGRYRDYSEEGRSRSQFMYVSMGPAPFHPQGVGQHGESDWPIDRPTYGHLGKKISFQDLPEDCQKLVLQDYVAIWGLGDE